MADVGGTDDGGSRALSEGRTYRHTAYGFAIESQFPLSSLDAASAANAQPVISISLATPDYFRVTSDGLAFDPGDWFHHSILPDGSVYMKADDVFEAIVAVGGRHVVCARADGVGDNTFESYFLSFIMSTSLAMQGEEPLHATVVDLGGRAIGLLGNSGAGKSTLAAFLMSQGAQLMADDMLRLTVGDGRAVAYRGPHRLKLFDDAVRHVFPGAVGDRDRNTISGKLMVRPPRQATGQDMSKPLASLFWLDEPAPSAPQAVSSERLAGLELARVLAASTMNIRYRTPARLARQLRSAERVAQVLPVYALRYERRYSLLEQVAREIRAKALR